MSILANIIGAGQNIDNRFKDLLGIEVFFLYKGESKDI